jgi:hypothetical protein
MKTVPIIVIIINKRLPAIISSNKLTGEKASDKKFLLLEATETNMNAKTAQKYNVTINFNVNFIIYFGYIYT